MSEMENINFEKQLELTLKLHSLINNKVNGKIINNFITKSEININYFKNDRNPLLYLIKNFIMKDINEGLFKEYLTILSVNGCDFNMVCEDEIIPLFELLKLKNSYIYLKIAKRNKANMYQIDNEGKNLLMKALELKANIQVIKFLYSLNYKLDYQDKNGNTIYIYAVINYSIYSNNKSLPYLLNNFIYNNDTIITFILRGKQKIPTLNYEILKIIKSNNELINIKNNDNETPLFIAIKHYRKIKIIEQLLYLGARTEDYFNNVLMVSAQYRNNRAFKYFLNYKPNLNYKNKDGDNVLHIAAKNNHNYLINTILNYINTFNKNSKYNNQKQVISFNINEQNIDGETALLIAVKKGNYKIISNLVTNGADTTITNNKQETPLIIAVRTGNEKIFDILIEIQKDININKYDCNHETPLMIALKNNHIEIAKKLIESGADISLVDADHRTPLMIAISKNYNELTDILLNNSNTSQLNAYDSKGKTPLLFAIEGNNYRCFQNLLEKGANPYVIDNKGNNILMIASKKGYYDSVRYIINNFDININSQNKHLNTALMKACKHKYVKIVEKLLENNAQTNITNKDKNDALLLASLNNDIYIFKNLMEKNANIDTFNNEGITPLIAFCKNDNLEFVKEMINIYHPILNYEDSKVKQKMDECFIDDIVKNNRIKVIRFLLISGYKLDVSNQNNNYFKLLSVILNNAKNRKYESVKYILNQPCFKDILDGFRRSEILIYACKNVDRNLINLCLNFDVDVNNTDNEGNTALIEASRSPNLSNYIVSLIERGANVNASNNEGSTPLLNSCNTDDVKVFNKLKYFKPNIFAVDNEGNNALMYACCERMHDRTKYIVLNNDHYEKIEYLINNGINVNAVNNDGETALMQAVRGGKLSIVNLLFSNKADINILNRKGKNALVIGLLKAYNENSLVEKKYETIIRFLIRNGADVNIPVDSIGNSVLMFLIMKNDLSMIKYLIKHAKNIDLMQKNHLGHNAFNYALKCKNDELIRMISNNKQFNKHIEDDYGNDMIMYTICGHNPVYFNIFIKDVNNDNINKTNHVKDTYLIMASKINNERVIKTLLSKNNIDVNACNSLGNTALHYASSKGNICTLNNLINKQADLEIRNFEREIPIMVACRFKQKEAINILLDKGANTNFVDNYIHSELGSYEFTTDREKHIDLMIKKYAEICNPAPENYMIPKTLVKRINLFYTPALKKDYYENLGEELFDALSELIQTCFEIITGAN